MAGLGDLSPDDQAAMMPETYANPLVKSGARGLGDLVAGPGLMMTANPYPQGSEEASWFEDQRAKAGQDWARDAAMATMGTGAFAGVPASGAETVLGAGLIRRDPSLWHGISQVKLPKPVSEMTASHVPMENVAERAIAPADLQGGMLLPAIGDRSIANTNLHGFNGYKFDNPVEMQGGHGFMAANADKDVAWASGSPVIGRIANNVRKLSEGNQPVYFPYTAMGERSVDFSHHISSSLAEALKQQPLARSAQREFNAAMKAEDSDFGAIKDWPGIASDKLKDYLLSAKGDVRNKFAKVMDTNKFQSMGFPSVAEARFAATDPRLLNAPTGASGLSVAKLDPSGRVLKDVSGHLTYDTDLGGQYVGGLGRSIPKEVFYPDLISAYQKLGYEPYRHDYLMARGVKGAPIAQRADQQWVDSVSQWMADNPKETMKYANGGDVLSPEDQAAMMPEMQNQPDHFARGGLLHGQPGMTSSAGLGGLINSPIAGRTDRLPMNAKPNSYVIPADVVSGLGQGNTMAGGRILDAMLKHGPYGSDLGKAPHVHANLPKPPAKASYADGGVTNGVPIIVAGGEYSVDPEIVTALGQGDTDKGHEVLDKMVLQIRKQTIKQLKSLPRPVK